MQDELSLPPFSQCYLGSAVPRDISTACLPLCLLGAPALAALPGKMLWAEGVPVAHSHWISAPLGGPALENSTGAGGAELPLPLMCCCGVKEKGGSFSVGLCLP